MVKTTKQQTKGILRVSGKGVEVSVFVVPRSSRCAIAGTHDQALKIKLTSPPVEGQANKQCCIFIAKQLGVPKTQVRIIRGEHTRLKVLRIEGVTEDQVRERLF